MSEPDLRDELRNAEYEPMLPIENKLVAWGAASAPGTQQWATAKTRWCRVNSAGWQRLTICRENGGSNFREQPTSLQAAIVPVQKH